jgi:magnesium transporter
MPKGDAEGKCRREMPKGDANVLHDLLTYDPETTSGVMTPCIISMCNDMTCDEAIQHLHKSQYSDENVENIYVVDTKNHLVGVLSINKLLWATSSRKVPDIMCGTIEDICAMEQDKELVVKMMT